MEPYDIVYETYGSLNADKSNVVVVCHALTGSHHAAGRYEGDIKSGWWDGLIGPNKAIDTNRFFVICSNVIGSCFGSTGPVSNAYPSQEPYRYSFPVVSIKDMVRAQRILFDRLGIHHVHAIIGGSMGGMQALEFAVSYPDFASKIVPIATTHATSAWAIAFNKIAREAIVKDPDFKNGHYDIKYVKQHGLTGMAIGRMAGHISFLSHDSMDKKFGREYKKDDSLFELFGKFQVESYLEYNGYNFSKWFDPLSYLYITKAINIYDLSRGFDSLKNALQNIHAEVYLISFKNDMLFPSSEMREIYDTLKEIGKTKHSFKEIESNYGHDAFLVEIDKFDKDIRMILDE